MDALQMAEAAEHALSRELDRIVVKSVIYTSGERDPREPPYRPPDQGKLYMMGDDPRLPKMPERPTLFDFFKYRFGPSTHLLQSARLAMKRGENEKIVLACLLHDIANIGFIRGDHGYWGAQLVEPYIEAAYREARKHKWYMSSRLITVNDLYAFDPAVRVELEEFTDVVGRNFKQPKEGLGFDGSPTAHMWRTIIWPTKFL
jgi:hypothetical protein